MKIISGPFQFSAKACCGEGGYTLPGATEFSALDFRPASESAYGVAQSGRAIFAVPDDYQHDSSYELLANEPAAKMDGRLRSFFASRFGHNPEGDTLAQALMDLFRNGDPSGLSAHKPIMPGTPERRTGPTCWMDLYFGGRIVSQPFEWGEKQYTNRLRDLIRLSMKAQWLALRAEAQQLRGAAKKVSGIASDVLLASAARAEDQIRRIVDAEREKYGIGKEDLSWKDFLPPDMASEFPGLLPRETIITDPFTRSDATTLGTSAEGWSWVTTPTSTDVALNTNAAKITVATGGQCRASTNLSTVDHYAKADGSTFAGTTKALGLIVRSDTSAFATATNYFVFDDPVNPGWQIAKRVSGSNTTLTSGSNTPVDGDVLYLSANGSTLLFKLNGVDIGSVSNSDITTGVQAGLRFFAAQNSFMDNFEASDAAASGLLYTQLERDYPRGIARGTFAGSI